MKFPCPLCGKMRTVKINRRSKPYLRCDDCGVLMFVNRQSGIKRIGTGKGFINDMTKEKETLASFFDE